MRPRQRGGPPPNNARASMAKPRLGEKPWSRVRDDLGNSRASMSATSGRKSAVDARA